MKWVSDIIISRRSNESNVILLVTDDPIRISQLRTLLTSEESKKIGFRRFNGKNQEFVIPDTYEVDILTGTIYSIVEKRRTVIQKSLKQILMEGETKPTAYIFHYIYRGQEAKSIENILMSYALNDKFYLHRSTIFVFTASELLFSSNLLNFVSIVKISPSDKEKMETIDRIKRLYGISVPNNIIELLKGLNLHETETVMLKHVLTNESLEGLITSTKRKKFEQLGVKMEYPRLGLQRIGGYESIKRWLMDNIINIVRKLDLAKQLGIGLPRGVLFIGPPGTGKTIFSKATASELKIPFLQVNASDVFRGIVGETEARVNMIMELANEVGPSILFIDEAEQLFQSRERVLSTDSGITQRATAMFISGLGREDRNFIVFMTANYVQLLDRALLRRGRIDAIIPVLYPNRKAREEIVKVHTTIVRKIPLSRDFSPKKIAEMTPWWSGAEIESLIIDAVKLMIKKGQERLDMNTIVELISKYKIDANKRKQTTQKYLDMIRDVEDAPIIEELYQEQLEELEKEPTELEARTLI